MKYHKFAILLIILFTFTGCRFTTFNGPPIAEKKKDKKPNTSLAYEEDKELAIKFCQKTGGIYQNTSNTQRCIIDNEQKYDIMEYFYEECKPLGVNCIVYHELVSGNDKTGANDEFIGKIYTLPQTSDYNDYLLMEVNGEQIRYGLDARTVDKKIDPNIKSEILGFSNTNDIIIIKGVLLENVADVGGHRIIVDKIFLKSKSGLINEDNNDSVNEIEPVVESNNDLVDEIGEVVGEFNNDLVE